MKLTINFRSALAPLTMDLDRDEHEVLGEVKEAISSDGILDFTDIKGDRIVLPASAIGYVSVPSGVARRVGFGRS